MSIDTAGGEPLQFDDVSSREESTFPEPRAHGAAVMNVLNDFNGDRDQPATERGTLYARALSYWREHVEDPENEPYLAAEEFDADWLPEGDYALLVKSSGWKAGTGLGDNYTQFFEQHIMLREIVEDDNGEISLQKAPVALHVEIMPQYTDMVYSDGNPLECPYGEGTRLLAWTTWANTPQEIEGRMFDAIEAVYGPDSFDLDDRDPESRRLPKAEAHIRFDIEKKGAMIESLEQSKQLIAWGGQSKIQAGQERQREGWLEAHVQSDRWHLLGFEPQRYSTEAKIYQIGDWHTRPKSDEFHHPKLEASYDGVDRGELPHVEEWDEVMDHLRTIVATHAEWAGVGREHLIADDFFDGPDAPRWPYEKPTGRKEMLRNRYEDIATEIYREALKESTVAVYDILRTIAEESGATYDLLEERTGLARSTVRYHCRRLAESGVVKRLGNPVVVVMVSRELLDRAREILREVRPSDTAEDMADRAEKREERREEQQDEQDEDSDDQDDTGEETVGFVYLSRLSCSCSELALAIDRGVLDEKDVRVRADELPDRLR